MSKILHSQWQGCPPKVRYCVEEHYRMFIDSLTVVSILPSDWENSVTKEDQGTTSLVKDHNCHRIWRVRIFVCISFQLFYTRSGNKSVNLLPYTDLRPKAWSHPDYQTLLLILRDLLCLPVAMESEGCSQWIVHGWSRIQVGCRKETQQEDTDSSLTCPVQRRSLGSACKEKYFQCKVPVRSAVTFKTDTSSWSAPHNYIFSLTWLLSFHPSKT